jgi:hypothetical protein
MLTPKNYLPNNSVVVKQPEIQTTMFTDYSLVPMKDEDSLAILKGELELTIDNLNEEVEKAKAELNAISQATISAITGGLPDLNTIKNFINQNTANLVTQTYVDSQIHNINIPNNLTITNLIENELYANSNQNFVNILKIGSEYSVANDSRKFTGLEIIGDNLNEYGDVNTTMTFVADQFAFISKPISSSQPTDISDIYFPFTINTITKELEFNGKVMFKDKNIDTTCFKNYVTKLKELMGTPNNKNYQNAHADALTYVQSNFIACTSFDPDNSDITGILGSYLINSKLISEQIIANSGFFNQLSIGFQTGKFGDTQTDARLYKPATVKFHLPSGTHINAYYVEPANLVYDNLIAQTQVSETMPSYRTSVNSTILEVYASASDLTFKHISEISSTQPQTIQDVSSHIINNDVNDIVYYDIKMKYISLFNSIAFKSEEQDNLLKLAIREDRNSLILEDVRLSHIGGTELVIVIEVFHCNKDYNPRCSVITDRLNEVFEIKVNLNRESYYDITQKLSTIKYYSDNSTLNNFSLANATSDSLFLEDTKTSFVFYSYNSKTQKTIISDVDLNNISNISFEFQGQVITLQSTDYYIDPSHSATLIVDLNKAFNALSSHIIINKTTDYEPSKLKITDSKLNKTFEYNINWQIVKQSKRCIAFCNGTMHVKDTNYLDCSDLAKYTNNGCNSTYSGDNELIVGGDNAYVDFIWAKLPTTGGCKKYSISNISLSSSNYTTTEPTTSADRQNYPCFGIRQYTVSHGKDTLPTSNFSNKSTDYIWSMTSNIRSSIVKYYDVIRDQSKNITSYRLRGESTWTTNITWTSTDFAESVIEPDAMFKEYVVNDTVKVEEYDSNKVAIDSWDIICNIGGVSGTATWIDEVKLFVGGNAVVSGTLSTQSLVVTGNSTTGESSHIFEHNVTTINGTGIKTGDWWMFQTNQTTKIPTSEVKHVEETIKKFEHIDPSMGTVSNEILAITPDTSNTNGWKYMLVDSPTGLYVNKRLHSHSLFLDQEYTDTSSPTIEAYKNYMGISKDSFFYKYAEHIDAKENLENYHELKVDSTGYSMSLQNDTVNNKNTAYHTIKYDDMTTTTAQTLYADYITMHGNKNVFSSVGTTASGYSLIAQGRTLIQIQESTGNNKTEWRPLGIQNFFKDDSSGYFKVTATDGTTNDNILNITNSKAEFSKNIVAPNLDTSGKVITDFSFVQQDEELRIIVDDINISDGQITSRTNKINVHDSLTDWLDYKQNNPKYTTLFGAVSRINRILDNEIIDIGTHGNIEAISTLQGINMYYETKINNSKNLSLHGGSTNIHLNNNGVDFKGSEIVINSSNEPLKVSYKGASDNGGRFIIADNYTVLTIIDDNKHRSSYFSLSKTGFKMFATDTGVIEIGFSREDGSSSYDQYVKISKNQTSGDYEFKLGSISDLEAKIKDLESRIVALGG